MSEQANNLPWVGFGELADLMAEADIADRYGNRPNVVYLNATKHTRPGKVVGLIDYSVAVAYIAADRVLYCRLPMGGVQTIPGGHVLDDKAAAAAQARCDQALPILRDAIEDRGFRVVAASVAEPAGLALLNGWAACLRYDRESDSIVADAFGWKGADRGRD